MNSREIDSLKLLLVALTNFDDSTKWINLAKKQVMSESGLKILKAITSWNSEDIKECSSDMLDQLSKVTDKKSEREFLEFWD